MRPLRLSGILGVFRKKIKLKLEHSRKILTGSPPNFCYSQAAFTPPPVLIACRLSRFSLYPTLAD